MIGKNYTYILLIFCLLAMSCEREQHEAKTVSENFLKAYTQGNYFEAENYIEPESRIEWRKYVTDVDPQPENDYFLKKIIDLPGEDKAVVIYYLSGMKDKQHLWLEKHNEQWMVKFERTDPMGVAEKFLYAYYSNDIEKAKIYSTPSARNDLEHMKVTNEGNQSPKKIKITGVKYNTDRDKAVVYYVEEGKEQVMKINMRKIDGEWKVSFAKQEDWEFTEDTPIQNIKA